MTRKEFEELKAKSPSCAYTRLHADYARCASSMAYGECPYRGRTNLGILMIKEAHMW